MADLTSADEPLYYVLSAVDGKGICCAIIGDTAYCLDILYAEWVQSGNYMVGDFDTGKQEIVPLAVQYE
ncbi:MAG: hypothetical protein HFE73_09805 [Firmicutes bacterium]|nr:hypothetical protein [Bacillota bacterium]